MGCQRILEDCAVLNDKYSRSTPDHNEKEHIIRGTVSIFNNYQIPLPKFQFLEILQLYLQ